MSEQTLTFSEVSKGFPSFYSFYPDLMLGMNNHFYTWKDGNLYVHNSDNVSRCNFYGVQYNSYIKTVINDNPLENKLFKTISLIGTDPWDIVNMETDLQTGANIDATWFEEKESSWFAYVRNESSVPANVAEYPLRSLNGIGRSEATQNGATTLIMFNIPNVQIGSIVSVGDLLYYALPPYSTPVLCGEITGVQVDWPNGVNQILVDTTIGANPPIQDAYFLFIKNQIAESHGILGHYCILEIENSSTEKVELFTISSDLMKSFP